jgi:antitoxin (DNA-binding transcriptional repressor) of toxin-antitoxin stability system
MQKRLLGGKFAMEAIITLEEAQARLPEVIDRLGPGEEIVITRNAQPVARLVRGHRVKEGQRRVGSGSDKILFMADDFDAPLDDFKEYME